MIISDVFGGEYAAEIQVALGEPVVFDCVHDALMPIDCSDPDTECAVEYETAD